jgi:thymidylate synthase
MVNAWNVGELDQMVLPPCHYGFQVYTRELSEGERGLLLQPYGLDPLTKEGRDRIWKENNLPTRAISLMWNQRSVDTFLGLPFNIASYGLLLEIIAKEVNMVPDELIGNLGDTHLYLNHIEQAKEQVGREYTSEERHELLKIAMGDFYQTAVDEQVPFGGGLSEYYESYKIPYYTREPFELPTLKMNPIFLANLEHKGFDEAINGQVNFELENYQSHPSIKAPLSN